MIRRGTIVRWAGALLLIGIGGCGGGAAGQTGAGARAGAAGGSSGGASGTGGANACAPAFPSEPGSATAALGLVEAQLVAAGRRGAAFPSVFGDVTDQILAAADTLQTQAVEAVAADRRIPVPAGPPSGLPDPATCGVTVSALKSSTGQGWEAATFLAAANLPLAIDGNVAAVSYPPLDTQMTFGTVTTRLNQTTQLTLSLSGSHATVTVTLVKSVSTTDANGAALGATRETATATIDVDFCPNAGGVAAGMITFTGDGMASPAGGGAPTTYHVQATGTYQIHVNDMAETSSVDLEGDVQLQAAGASSIDIAATFSGNYADAANVGGTLKGQAQLQRGDGPASDVAAVTTAVYSAGLTASVVAETAAKKKWRGGACVEVRADPPSMMVDADAQLTISATPFHKLEMTSLQAPVVATLSGVKSLDPVNKPVAAPASFTFVAGNTWKQQGTVNLKSTSNRGIGTGMATYTVNCGEKMRTMCANLGEALNPDTCQCECRTDLIVGGAPPNCQWKGTVKVTANVSGQMDMAALDCHEVWTLSYDATFTPVGLNNALINLGSSIQGRWRDDNVCTTQLARPCVATFATDDSISGAVPAIMVIQGAGSGVLELSITSTSGAFSPFGLTGTTTNTISDDICLQLWPPASSTEHRVPIQGFAGSGPATGTTFRGSSVNPIWGLPDGTQAAVTVSWDLQLVTMPVSP